MITELTRREFIVSTGLTAVLLSGSVGAKGKDSMFGLIGKIKTKPGKRDELAKILLKGVKKMPGCQSYIVANDPKDGDALWITEVWDDEASHKASLTLPSVKDAISKGRPLIESFAEYHTTEPIGGHGIKGK